MGSLDNMSKSAIAVVGLSAVTLTGLAVVGGYKATGLIDNTTADRFTAGLAIFGTFLAIIVLSLVGKVIVGIFKPGKD